MDVIKYNVLSLGAGVQSSTLALMAEKNQLVDNNGEIIKVDFAVFADTQGEPEEVYEWLNYLKKEIKSFPIDIISHGNLEEDNVKLVQNNTNMKLQIPMFTLDNTTGKGGILQRRCTRNFKVDPILKYIRKKLNVRSFREYERVLINKDLGYKKGNVYYNVTYPNLQINQLLGISIDEATRMKPSREKWITNIFPLIDLKMSRKDCIYWMEQNYKLKPPRSACWFCPYRSDEEWNEMKINDPKSFNRAVDFEKRIQSTSENIKDNKLNSKLFLHSSRTPLNEVIFDLSKKDKNNFNNECEGMCNN